MKTYEVEVKYTSYTTITVEAENEDEAEKLAWRELELDGGERSNYGVWTLESIEEMETQEDAQ